MEYDEIEAHIEDAKKYVKKTHNMIRDILRLHDIPKLKEEVERLYNKFMDYAIEFHFYTRKDHEYGYYDPEKALLLVEKIRVLVQKSKLCKNYMLKQSTFHGLRMHPVHHEMGYMPPTPSLGNPGGRIYHKYANNWKKHL